MGAHDLSPCCRAAAPDQEDTQDAYSDHAPTVIDHLGLHAGPGA
jgi:hypothetical protein